MGCPMKCLADGVEFTLDMLLLEWRYPDGSRTGVCGETLAQARRAMMFGALALARSWKARLAP